MSLPNNFDTVKRKVDQEFQVYRIINVKLRRIKTLNNIKPIDLSQLGIANTLKALLEAANQGDKETVVFLFGEFEELFFEGLKP